jgi:hypothetical protein
MGTFHENTNSVFEDFSVRRFIGGCQGNKVTAIPVFIFTAVQDLNTRWSHSLRVSVTELSRLDKKKNICARLLLRNKKISKFILKIEK